jgi:spore germination protein GerM
MPERIRPIGIVVGLSVLMVASASTAALFAWLMPRSQPPVPVNSGKPTDPLAQPLTPKPAATPNPLKSTAPKVLVPVQEQRIQVYWLKAVGNQWSLVAVPLPVKASDRPEDLLNAAVNHLLTSQPDRNLTTTIPEGTQLKSLKVESNGIHVDLSQSFKTSGGSTGTTGRVAQLLYTVTSLNPNAPVWLAVEGKQLESLGGEGLMLEQPLTRQSFDRDFK